MWPRKIYKFSETVQWERNDGEKERRTYILICHRGFDLLVSKPFLGEGGLLGDGVILLLQEMAKLVQGNSFTYRVVAEVLLGELHF